MSDTPVLEARNLKKHYPVTKGLAMQKVVGWVRAVDDVSFAVPAGETLSLVGESGAGKTTVSRMVLLLERLSGGQLLFDGRDVGQFGRAELKEYRSSVQAVFQDPWGSMDPRMRVRTIVAEPMVVNGTMNIRKSTTGSSNCWRMLACGPTRRTCIRTSSAAASVSALPWRARWRSIRGWWCWTNRSRRWTCRFARRS